MLACPKFILRLLLLHSTCKEAIHGVPTIHSVYMYSKSVSLAMPSFLSSSFIFSTTCWKIAYRHLTVVYLSLFKNKHKTNMSLPTLKLAMVSRIQAFKSVIEMSQQSGTNLLASPYTSPFDCFALLWVLWIPEILQICFIGDWTLSDTVLSPG